MPHWAASFKQWGHKDKRNPPSVSNNIGQIERKKNCGGIQLRKSTSTERNSPLRQALPTTKTCDHTMPTVFCAAIASMPLFLCPANTALIQRCPSAVAKYCAKFSWCCRQISNHELDAVSKCRSRPRECRTHVARRSSHLPGV